jgi:hypothetical protein
MAYGNGEYYDGKWYRGMKHGHGSMQYTDGSAYIGLWENNHPHGRGVMAYPSGAEYDGNWEHGRRHGDGWFLYAPSEDGEQGSYEGKWVDDQRHGKGLLKYANGDEYKGDFDYGKKQGTGIFNYANGDFYEGQYQNDLKHGQGTYNHKDGNRYRGAWFAGKQHGIGTFFANNGNRYEGEWIDGMKEGKGMFQFASGNVYTGAWSRNAFNGEGILYYASGNRYEGTFTNNKQDGKGLYVYFDGRAFEGEWKNGKQVGGRVVTKGQLAKKPKTLPPVFGKALEAPTVVYDEDLSKLKTAELRKIGKALDMKMTSWSPEVLRKDLEAKRAEDPETFLAAYQAVLAPPPPKEEEKQPEPPGVKSRDRDESFGEPNEKDLNQMRNSEASVQEEFAPTNPIINTGAEDVNDTRKRLANNLGVQDDDVVPGGSVQPPPPPPQAAQEQPPPPPPAAVQPIAAIEKKVAKSILKKVEPPPPAPAPPAADVTFARVLFEFLPENDDELFLKKGEIFVITGYEDDEWAEGQTKDGRQGLFPLNYVQEVSEAEIDKLEFRNKSEGVATQSGAGTMDVFSSDKQQRYWDLVEKVSSGQGTNADNLEVEELGRQLQVPIEQNQAAEIEEAPAPAPSSGRPNNPMAAGGLLGAINARRID